MLFDQQTVRDLEIFQTRDGKPGVFQTLDLTKTPGGSLALRRRFEGPFSEGEDILRVQEGVRFLITERIRFPLDPSRAAEVRQYLDSSWDVGSRARGLRFFLEAVVVSIRYRDLFNHAVQGVSGTKHLVGRILPFLTDLLAKEPPAEVRSLVVELMDLVQGLQLGKIRLNRRPWSVFRADRFLRVFRRDEFRRFFSLLSELDALIAMAEVVEERGFVFPEVVGGRKFVFEAEGVLHPFLEDPVGNPVSLTEGKTLVFLTGPNMAGKTTYLKSVGVAALLAHLGMGVPARKLRFAPLDAVSSSLSPEENLLEGLSYFMAEVRRVREIAEVVASRERTLVLFDEVFRGTNVKDAFDASLMVILGFARRGMSGFIFSSHLAELAEDLEKEPSIHFAFFDGQIRDARAWYDFRLKEGVSQQRFGLQLLEQEGVPQLLRSLEA